MTSSNSNFASPTPLVGPSPTVSLASLLGQLATQCSDCEFYQVTVLNNNNQGPKPSRLDLNTPNGESAGSLFIPQLSGQENTTLTITFSTNVPQNFFGQDLGGTILDITLTDSEDQPITQLDTPLVICLALPNDTKIDKGKTPCLSYYDERKAKWRCEDECLTNPGKENLFCGKTDHLTNFALLLSGSGGNEGNDPCSSESHDNTLAWVSLGMVAGAIVIVALCVVLVEIRIRLETRRINIEISNKLRAGQCPSVPQV